MTPLFRKLKGGIEEIKQPLLKIKGPPLENCEDNNTKKNNTRNNTEEGNTPAGNDFEQFTRAYGVMSNGPLINEWCNAVEKSQDPKQTKKIILAHLPGYMKRTDPDGKDNKRYRSTAINYLKKCLWLNDLNPVEVSATVVPKSRYKSLSN